MTLGQVQIQLISYKSAEILDEVLRNLKTLFGTVAGTQAGDRDFGLDMSFVDMPLPTAQAMYSAEIIKKTRKYESRAEVQRVEWNTDADKGKIIPRVVISINE